MGEIIFMGEKSKHRLTGWPGDEYYEKTINKISIQPSTSSSNKSNHFFNSDTSKKTQYYASQKNHFENDVEDKRPSSMKSRYFSIENIQKLNEASDASVTNNETNITEEPEFLKRKDYLLKKLFQSRNLPDPSTDLAAKADTTKKPTETTNLISTAANLTQEITNASSGLFNKPDRKHSFQDEFIPLFDENKNKPKPEIENKTEGKNDSDDSTIELNDQSSTSNKRTIYNPKLNTIESYKGPYSIKCLMRSRQYLIDCFKPYSTTYSRSNFEDRLFEILKLKMNIKSKFDDDKRLLRKIKRETALEKQAIVDRIEWQNRRVQQFLAKSSSTYKKLNTHSHFVEYDDNDSDDSDVISIENEPPAKRKKIETNKKDELKKKKIVTINLEEEEEIENDEDEYESSNLIKMISNVETFENLDYEEEEEDIKYDEDSKCIQFGNYSNNSKIKKDIRKKSSKKIKTKVKPTSTLRKNERQTTSSSSAATTDGYRIDRVGMIKNKKQKKHQPNPTKTSSSSTNNNELNEYELRYRRLRNERNKLLRKKKGIEINAKREEMSNELKSLRKIMKKIRRKQHSKSKFLQKSSVQPSAASSSFNNNNNNKNSKSKQTPVKLKIKQKKN